MISGVLAISNCIAMCSLGNYHRRHVSEIKGVVVHRIDVGDTAEEVSAWFRKYPAIGKMPYTFFIRKDGTVEQALPLSYRAPAGKILNQNFVHIGVHGDFTKERASPKQALSLTKLVVALCAGLDTLHVQGHTETMGASSDPKKECPGERLNIRGLREYVIDHVNRCEPLEGVVL